MNPLFQRRHYEYLVQRLALDTRLSSTTKFEALNWLVATLKADNKNFNPERFYSVYHKLVEKYIVGQVESSNDHNSS